MYDDDLVGKIEKCWLMCDDDVCVIENEIVKCFMY